MGDSFHDGLAPTSRAKLGAAVGIGCPSCAYFDICGGVFDGFDCLNRCCGKPGSCRLACFQSRDFVTFVQDAGGFRGPSEFRALKQRMQAPLPRYIPCVHHGYRRVAPLVYPVVALPTFAAVRQCTAGPLFSSAEAIRSRFGLAPQTRIILLSVDKDRRLERYWQVRTEKALPTLLAQCGADHVTSPNFSFPVDVPRPDNMLNRTRSLVVAEEFSNAGLSVILHLNAVTSKDWEFWRDLLKEHPSIGIVAKEFQTGTAPVVSARWHVERLRRLEQAVGRRLHVIAVGGRRHLRFLATLSSFTIIDSVPFMRTMYRRALVRRDHKWSRQVTAKGEPLDVLLRANIEEYAKAIDDAYGFFSGCAQDFTTSPTRIAAAEEAKGPMTSDAQLAFDYACGAAS